jgi:hypothetical protein
MKRYIAFAALLCCLLLGLKSNAQPSALVAKVLTQLNIKLAACNEELIQEVQLPYNKALTVVVIPKYRERDEESFTLDSYILLVNRSTGKIVSKYVEEADDNGWVSDALRLEYIAVDPGPYVVKAGVKAFAIRLGFIGSSKPNPYNKEIISIFEPKGTTLKCILKNFEMDTYGGEWDMHCEGKFREETKVLSFSKNITQGYYQLLAKSKIKNIVSVKVNDDCQEKVTAKTITKILKFKNGTYQ